MRNLLLIAVLVSCGTARADGSYIAAGGGSAFTTTAPGWGVRFERRFEDPRPSGSETEPLAGFRIGADLASAGGRTGFGVPLGMYFGAIGETMRTSLGGGVGLLSIETDARDFHLGAAPFASAMLETTFGNTVMGLDARVARQALIGAPDYTIFSVLFVVGRRYDD